MSELNFKPCWKKCIQIEYAEISEPMTIETKEGNLTADPEKDFVLRGVQGELYPCKKDIFAQTYDSTPPPAATQGGSARECADDIKLLTAHLGAGIISKDTYDIELENVLTTYAESQKPAVPESARECAKNWLEKDNNLKLTGRMLDSANIIWWESERSFDLAKQFTAYAEGVTAEAIKNLPPLYMAQVQEQLNKYANKLVDMTNIEFGRRCEISNLNHRIAALEKQLADKQAEMINLKSICDSFDEFGQPLLSDCRFSPLAERVYGIISEQAGRIAALEVREAEAREIIKQFIAHSEIPTDALPNHIILDARAWLIGGDK